MEKSCSPKLLNFSYPNIFGEMFYFRSIWLNLFIAINLRKSVHYLFIYINKYTTFTYVTQQVDIFFINKNLDNVFLASHINRFAKG